MTERGSAIAASMIEYARAHSAGTGPPPAAGASSSSSTGPAPGLQAGPRQGHDGQAAAAVLRKYDVSYNTMSAMQIKAAK